MAIFLAMYSRSRSYTVNASTENARCRPSLQEKYVMTIGTSMLVIGSRLCFERVSAASFCADRGASFSGTRRMEEITSLTGSCALIPSECDRFVSAGAVVQTILTTKLLLLVLSVRRSRFKMEWYVSRDRRCSATKSRLTSLIVMSFG